MAPQSSSYQARLDVDRPGELNRMTTLFRIILVVPIAVVLGVLTSTTTRTLYDEHGQAVSSTSGGIAGGLLRRH